MFMKLRKSKSGEAYVATPDKEIAEIVKSSEEKYNNIG